MEEDDEEEDVDISDISPPQPHDSTYEPGASVTDVSELTEIGQPTGPNYEGKKYIVFESRLKELFQTCPVCNCNSNVKKRESGTFVAFTQSCPHCLYHRDNEVGGSYHMEKEGLRRCLDLVQASSLEVDYLVTDRHTQVKAYCVKERSLSLSKKLEKLSKVKECELIKKWLPAIKNHIYWWHTILAGMHFNENAKREQATSRGQPSFKISYPKYRKGKASAKTVKSKPTFGYVSELMHLVFTEVFPDPGRFFDQLNAVPVPEDLSAQFEKAPKEEVIAAHMSRFSRPAGGPGRDGGSPHTAREGLDAPSVSGVQQAQE
ncbi:hypothetical protein WMY93_004133 [Mugilogobius chulae]|uniref:Uncharacterized protein n=1 Tax=Mugilogobius chulae TaxID=88201 RepID=A0AAW0PNY6_9GOBI